MTQLHTYKSFIWLILILIIISFPLITSGQNVDLTKEISLNIDNVKVKDAIDVLSEICDIKFSYSNKIIDTIKVVSINVNDKTIEEVLDEFTYQLNIGYKVVENHIVLKRKRFELNQRGNEEVFTISGFIRDEETGESLIGATIFIKETSDGIITNPYGFYSLSVLKGNYTLLFSYIGYKNKEIEINLENNVEYSLSLIGNNEILIEVTVCSDEISERLDKSQMSKIDLKPQNIINMPEFGGEVGLVKSLQTLPGIKAHSDGSAFFFVRGGNKDQNLIMIDDAPIFNHSHLFGYYSAINPDVIQDIKIYKGDMPVSQGDRLSSIIDIHTKQGNLFETSVNGMLNPLIYGFSIDGPIKKAVSSYFLSFRHSNFKWLYNRNYPNLDLSLFDINAKVNYNLTDRDRVYFSFYSGRDNFMNNSAAEFGGISWDNTATSFRWNHIFNQRLFSNTVISASAYNYYLTLGDLTWNSAIKNINSKIDFTWYISSENTFRFGYSLSANSYNPGNLSYDLSSSFITDMAINQSLKNVLYLGDEYKINDKLSFKIGFRMPVWTNFGPAKVYLFDQNYQVSDTIIVEDGKEYKSFVHIDSRLGLMYKIGELSSLKISYGSYHQYEQMISNSISPFSSFEVWVPSGSQIKPQRADQISLGYNGYSKNLNLELSIEAYYKEMKNQIDYEPHANLLLNPLFEGELRFGKARSYGLEFMLRRNTGKLTGWISYTYSRTFKQINDINNNEEFPAFYDRPHDFTVFLSYHVSTRSNFSANWIYYTGSAITTPIGYYEFNGYTVPLYGDKNNDRLPDYHRLDLSFNWRINKNIKRYQHYLTFGIFNFYNRSNPVSINFNKVETKEGEFVVPADIYGTSEILTTQKYLLGVMPSITYKFKIN